MPRQTTGRIPTQRAAEMKFGTQITPTGTRFRLWAPQARAISLKLEADGRVLAMRPAPRGWYELEVEGAGHGTLYRFVLEDGSEVPDPASRFQPGDVLGPSEVIDPRLFEWSDLGWAGRPWEESVCYELHIGTFTPEGTFAAATERLDYLAELGVTLVELMPVNDFPGRWNWGYDGALLFAPDSSYGRPEDFKALIDRAHHLGLGVILDVVYNHFGPKGNALPEYAPVLTDRYTTPWGPAVNFDGEGSPMVRDFMLANARYWLTEFHLDGLRLDAVHEMRDEGFNHMLHDLALQIRGSTDGRMMHLVLENERNDPEWLRRTEDLRAGLYDAQWNDDVHHLLNVAIHGGRSSYASDYGGKPDWLGRAMAEGFAFQGEGVPTRQGQPKGAPSGELPPSAFIDFIQNHDQVGNRLFGERVADLVDSVPLRAAVALYLLSPHVPLIFMGEEWGTRQPFTFFSDVDPSLADAIRESRIRDFGKAVPSARAGQPYPDPMAESTFRMAKLDWSELGELEHRGWLEYYRRLLAVRATHIVPHLAGVGGHAGRHTTGDQVTSVDWQLNGAKLSLRANLSGDERPGFVEPLGQRLWLEGTIEGGKLGPWTVLWTIDEQGARR